MIFFYRFLLFPCLLSILLVTWSSGGTIFHIPNLALFLILSRVSCPVEVAYLRCDFWAVPHFSNVSCSSCGSIFPFPTFEQFLILFCASCSRTGRIFPLPTFALFLNLSCGRLFLFRLLRCSSFSSAWASSVMVALFRFRHLIYSWFSPVLVVAMMLAFSFSALSVVLHFLQPKL